MSSLPQMRNNRPHIHNHLVTLFECVVAMLLVLLLELLGEHLELLFGQGLAGHWVEDVILDVDVVAQE